jgi:hypothetical protein
MKSQIRRPSASYITILIAEEAYDRLHTTAVLTSQTLGIVAYR